MRKISYILITLLLINSCGKHDFISKNKRKLEEQIEEIQQTPEKALRKNVQR